MKEARSVLFRSRTSPRIKAPQTLKMGLKQGLNCIKRQISLPNAKRIKKHCSHGRNQIRPDGRSFCSKVKTVPRNKAAAYTKKLKQFPGTKAKKCVRMQKKIRNSPNYRDIPQSAETVRTRYTKKSEQSTKSASRQKIGRQNFKTKSALQSVVGRVAVFSQKGRRQSARAVGEGKGTQWARQN